MKRVMAGLVLVTVGVILGGRPSEGAEKGQIARGQYLVDRVAMCPECHTPRDADGALIRSQYLRGAPVPVSPPTFPGIVWAVQAPAIAGFSGYSLDDGRRLLTEGIVARTGRPPKAPMPRFRMSRQDAEAVMAYLRSLR